MKNYAVLGEKLGHTLSPAIHRQIFARLDIDGAYTALEVAPKELPGVISALKTLHFSGVNVTIPYKEKIMPYLDEISDEARAIGAVNTIHFDNGNAVGYNTDCYGFLSMLKRAKVDVSGRDAVIFGAGGGAKALITALQMENAGSILVVARSQDKLNRLKQQYKDITVKTSLDYRPEPAYIAINATPIGMFPNTGAAVVTEDYIRQYQVLADIVYNPLRTKFLSLGKIQGKTTVDGLYMLVDQAIKSQEIFQDRAIDLSIGTEIYNTLLPNFDQN